MNSTTRPRSPKTVIGAAIAAAVSVALPGFLVGGLSVQIRGEFAIAEGRYGWAMSTYFLAATTGSILLGRLAQVIGPRRQLTLALLGAAGVDLCIAMFADNFQKMIAFLAIAGICNAAAQTAVNLGLAQAGLPRLGLAIAIKQSGMPTASMLSGLAVPAIALTLGWRWAFVAAAGVALSALVGVQQTIAASVSKTATDEAQPSSPFSALVIAGVAAMFLSFGAGALNAWVVESGVDAGLGKASAGLMLSVGAALGIAIRVGWGMRLDRMSRHPFVVAGFMALGGAVGVLALSYRLPTVHIVATVLAFSGGWIWPVFLNFGVVRANEGRAASSTGVTQTGVYLGVFAAPLTAGAIIERSGYPTMWVVTASAMAIGGLLMARVSRRF
jgi:predicted MFS family arabinose efflux permease